MPPIRPIPAIQYAGAPDVSARIAPPYDVLDETAKAALLATDEHNIVAVDLPHLPAKTVGPDSTYHAAGERYRSWLKQGVLHRRDRPAMFVYQQTYTARGSRFERRGLIANVRVQPFGPGPDGQGGIHPHEQTFSGPKEDRLKLMRATRAQLSPIFGLHSDPAGEVHKLLSKVIESRKADAFGRTTNDDVLHEIWAVDSPDAIEPLVEAFARKDVFIADGHHRYNTALNYKAELEQAAGPLPDGHPATGCLFVLVAMQDPGMIVLPTHRVLGGMQKITWADLTKAAAGRLSITPFAGGADKLPALEAALADAGPHALGLFNPHESAAPLAIATPFDPDPLKTTHGDMSQAWRQLDVAIVQHLLVEQICEPGFCPSGGSVTWKFPHSLDQLRLDATAAGYQLGVVMRATPLEAIEQVSAAGELMPQKSTFFYPKLATGMVINPLE